MPRLTSLFLFFQVFAAFAQGQPADTLPKLYPSNISIFDIDAGLPISCTASGLVDRAGRLWVNPCYWQEEHRTVGFYQFNGLQSRFVEWGNLPENLAGSQAVLSGFTKSGALFGFFRGTGTSFFFNPDTRKARFHTLEKPGAEIVFLGETDSYDVILQAFSATEHLVYRFEQDTVQLLLSLPRSDPDNTDPFETGGSYPLLTGNDLWFSSLGKEKEVDLDGVVQNFGSIVQFNLATRAVRQYTLSDLFPNALPSPTDPVVKREVALGPNGSILMYLQAWDQYIQLDPGSGAVHLVFPFRDFHSIHIPRQANPFYELPQIKKDQVGNLLFYYKEGPEYRAVLQDKGGSYYDYTPVLLTAMNASRFDKGIVHNVWGKDFRRQVYLFTSSGLADVELKLSGPIKTCLNGIPTRAVSEINPKQFLVFPEGDWNIIKFNPETDRTAESAIHVVFDCIPSGKPYLKHLVDLVKDPKGYFWVPSDRQIIRFQGNGHCETFPVGVDFLKFVFLNEETIFLESDRQFFVYDLSSRKLSPYLVNGLPAKASGVVNQIVHSRRDSNVVWVAALDGLHRFNVATGTYLLIGRAEGFQDNRIMCIDEAADGRLWIGTYGGGLHIYDPGKGAISIVDQKQGLSNNIVVGILVDNAGVRWLSTYKGITLVSPQGRVLTRIYTQDGLSTNEFNRYSYCKSSNGHLLFGSVNGINYIEPEAVKAQLLNVIPLQIYLTELTYYDVARDSLITQQYWPSNHTNTLKLAAAHRYLSMQFALSSMLRIGENRFAYKIEGPDLGESSEWNYLGANNELNLQGLPAGRYNILIRGSDYRGNWTSEPLVIPIQAAEFFYRQTWFIALCILALLCLAVAWMYRQKIEQKRLEKELQKRTEEIMRARDQLVVQEKLASLGQLTAGIAHEIKNPLNFVNNFALDSSNLADRLIGRLEKIKDDIDAKIYQRMLHYLQDIKQNVLDIKSSGSTADRIVRSMMDHARGNSEKMQFLDLNHLLEETTHLAISGCKASKPDLSINFIETFDPLAPKIYGSPLNLSRALLNILNNACYALYEKQQAQGKDFEPELQVRTRAKDGYIEVCIHDNGLGIPPEIIKDIFTPFFTTKPTGGGNTGLGLSICFDIIVKEHGGQLEVDSEPGAYTEFTIQLPVTTGSPA